MRLIDTHTHINLRAFKDDADDTIQRALDAGVAVINVGTQIDTSRQAVELLKKHLENVYAVIGLHPTHTYAHDYEDDEEVQFKTREEHFDFGMYKELADNERVIGIGECGLDYYRMPEDRDPAEIKNLQKVAFEKQIQLAVETNKTLCIHCRPSEGTNDAYEDLFEMIRKAQQEYSGSKFDDRLPFSFEIHCFTGDLATALRFAQIGAYIGLNGIITFDKTGRSEELVKGLDLNFIVLETDAPYLSPKSKRGKRNEPSFIIEVAEKIAEWKNISVEEVMKVTTENARRVFNI